LKLVNKALMARGLQPLKARELGAEITLKHKLLEKVKMHLAQYKSCELYVRGANVLIRRETKVSKGWVSPFANPNVQAKAQATKAARRNGDGADTKGQQQ
jgi:hypothetical protein